MFSYKPNGLFGALSQSEWVVQESLFKRTKSEFIEETGVNLNTLRKWREMRLISFNPDQKELFDERELEETRFIKTLIQSGLSFETVQTMLSKLKKPYCYNFKQMFWDFEKEEWISIDRLVESRYEHYLDENYLELLEDCLKELSKELEDNIENKNKNIYEIGDYLIIKKLS